ncbi:hypothetical protein AWH63_11095 [Marinobacter sp. C18]|nr:hypothetical protein AWH63_11095 [Marinobacter sp. C18]
MADERYFIEWCRSSYRPGHGFITHAVPESKESTRAVCGARTDEGHAAIVGIDGEPGCLRCRSSLRKQGIID